MSVEYLIYLFVGKILIFFGNKFAEDNEIGNQFIRKLLSCGLCWGLWTYTALAFFLGESLFEDIYYVPVLSQIITGGISSLLVHLISIGWREQFTNIIIE